MNHYSDPYDDPKKPITSFGYEDLYDRDETAQQAQQAQQAKQEEAGIVDMQDWDDFD